MAEGLEAFAIAVIFDLVGSSKHNSTANGLVLASTVAIVILEPVAPRVTRITQLQRTDLKLHNAIELALSKFAAKYTLSVLDSLHEKYLRNGLLVDTEEVRRVFMDRIEHTSTLTEEQKVLVRPRVELKERFEKNDGVPETVFKSISPTERMSMKKESGWFKRSIGIGRYC